MTPESMQGEGELVLARLRTEAAQYGLTVSGLEWAAGRFDRQLDPSSGEEALLASWRIEGRQVRLTLRADGQVYAECDLLMDHPKKPGMWMDTLSLWGTPALLKAEPNLIQKPA